MNFEDIPAFEEVESEIVIPISSTQFPALGPYVEILLGSAGEF